jgi:hypothetical protein
MTREEYLLQAKTSIFGQPPACPLALIGHNMAVTYFTPLIWEAEPVLLKMSKPPAYLITQMEKAFFFPSYSVLRNLPAESMATLKQCTKNFKNRYTPVMEQNLKRFCHHQREIVIHRI